MSLLPKTQFTLQNQNSEKPASGLWVRNDPLSVDDKVIETALNKLGCEMRSTVRKELARNTDGKLSSWPAVRLYYRPHNATPKDMYNGHIFCGIIPQRNEGEER